MKVSALGVEEQRVNVIIDFDDETEPASLGDGYRVEVRIVIWSAEPRSSRCQSDACFGAARSGRCSSSRTDARELQT